MAGARYVAPPAKEGMSGVMKAFLIVLGLIVLLVGGCVASVTIAASVFSDEIGDAVEEFGEAQAEAMQETSIVEGTCRLEAGFPVVDVRVDNESGGQSDYFITVEFSDGTGTKTGVPVEFNKVDSGSSKTEEARGLDSLSEDGLMCRVTEVFRFGSR